MKNDNDLMLLLAAAGVFLYMRSKGQFRRMEAPLPPVAYGGGLASMPGNVGSGLNQVQNGALTGFLQAIKGAMFAPNTLSGTVVPTPEPENFYTPQEAVDWDGWF